MSKSSLENVQTIAWVFLDNLQMNAYIWKRVQLFHWTNQTQYQRLENEIQFFKFSTFFFQWNLLTFSLDFLKKSIASSFINEAWIVHTCPLQSLRYLHHDSSAHLLFITPTFPEIPYIFFPDSIFLDSPSLLQKFQFLLMVSDCHFNKRHHILWQYVFWFFDRPLKLDGLLLWLYCNFEIVLQSNIGLIHFVLLRTSSFRFLWKFWKINTFDASVSCETWSFSLWSGDVRNNRREQKLWMKLEVVCTQDEVILYICYCLWCW